MKKKVTALVLSLALALGLAACGGPSSDGKTIKVGATPAPHAAILEVVQDILAEDGYTLEIVEYDDYVTPNTSLEDGSLDANYFQHITYMNEFNAEHGTHLVSAAGIHYEPFGLYAGKCASLEELADGAQIAVPNDGTNEARALLLLEQEGVSGCDALVTLTGLDELNMIISLYGASCKVPQVITKLGHIENTDILGNLSLDSVISPKELCCNTIVQYVRAMKNQTGAALTVHTIADGQAEAMEFLVDGKVRHCGVPLKNLKLKKGVLVVCIAKGAKMEIPNGDSFFQSGDIVYIVTSKGKNIFQLNDIFES